MDKKKTWKRSNIATNSRKTLKILHIKNFFNLFWSFTKKFVWVHIIGITLILFKLKLLNSLNLKYLALSILEYGIFPINVYVFSFSLRTVNLVKRMLRLLFLLSETFKSLYILFFSFGRGAWLLGPRFLNQGLNLHPSQGKHRVLTTVPPGNFLQIHFLTGI